MRRIAANPVFASARTTPRSRLGLGKTTPRSAFTIVEMVVCVGILGILMLMAGTIFSLTLRSSGEANALIEVHQSIRAFEQTLREDLRYVQPGSSLLAIQGNTINAYWTRDGQEADDDGNPRTGYPHPRDLDREVVASGAVTLELPRADLLMFFTARPGVSFADPRVSGRLQQVVYGHAELGELSATGAWTVRSSATFDSATMPRDLLNYTPSKGEYSRVAATIPAGLRAFGIPARDWHLARRSVLIIDQTLGTDYYPAADLNDADESSSQKDNNPVYSNLVRQNYIRDGRRDYIVNGSGFDFRGDILEAQPDPLFDNGFYLSGSNIVACDDDECANAAFRWMGRSWLDSDPPAAQSCRLGHYLLPNCASFKVEWALEVPNPGACDEQAALDGSAEPGLRDIFWVDPGDFAGTIARLDHRMATPPSELGCIIALRAIRDRLVLQDPTDTLPANRDPERFLRIAAQQASSNINPYPVHLFYPRKPHPADPTGSTTWVTGLPDPLFPKALRITVDVYDRAGRLARPIRHVMVLPVGQG